MGDDSILDRVMSHGFWGINTIGLPDSLVCASHSFWLSIMFFYEAHNYDSVGKEICAKIAVCFDQSEGWKFVRVVAVAMSRNKVARSSNNKMQLIPSGIFKLCNRYTFTVLAQCSQPWWGTGIKYEWLKHWGIEDKLVQTVLFVQTALLQWPI